MGTGETISEKMADKSFFKRLNSIPAAPANYVVYHNLCWVKAKRKAIKVGKEVEDYDYIRALTDAE